MGSLSTEVILAGAAAAFQCLRWSIDLVAVADAKEQKESEDDTDKREEATATSSSSTNEKKETPTSSTYGSIGGKSVSSADPSSSNDEENPLIKSAKGSKVDHLPSNNDAAPSSFGRAVSVFSTIIQLVVGVVLLLVCVCDSIFVSVGNEEDGLASSVASWLRIVTVTVLLSGLLAWRLAPHPKRFHIVSRVLLVTAYVVLVMSAGRILFMTKLTASGRWVATSIGVSIALVTTMVSLEAFLVPYPSSQPTVKKASKNQFLSRGAILTLLRPYFWPDATSSSAALNRLRAILTWVCVIMSKVCNLLSPILLGWASTALSRQDYVTCMKYSCSYAAVGFLGAAFREGQSLIYLKVAQAAFVQLSETTFWHLHSLSLDWHLRKKLGEVLRSMDRGIAACDTLMKYLFLWLLPALAECVVVCVIFATYFNYWPLAFSVGVYVWIYILWTILVTLWRKKFRKAVVKSDNKWHDRCTDSLINFETVKYFTAETYEMRRFGEAVKQYQSGSVDVQASLSVLNVTQRFILQLCLATSLSMAALGIQQKWTCCESNGCEDGNSQCCSDHPQCTGMDVGDFIAVLTYTIQLFTPLNYLGSIYNSIVMAIIDLTHLSELLAENPDVVDSQNATRLPDNNTQDADPDVAVEFDNVYFHYPTQPEDNGLQGLSFKMKRGTTTAVVGPTGAGKTTLSRLLFRFYDVLGGAVKVNGVDVKEVTQKSLRGAIGVVPQTASLFNDTLRANIVYGRRDATEEELLKVSRDAQLTSFIGSLDEGLDTLVGDRGLKLSGGEQQRTSIARCLLKDPAFVVLDEATSALDTITENSIQNALDSLGKQRTVLVIAHRLGTIRHADNIIVLKDGRVAEEGNHDELLARQGLYAEMWQMQLDSSHGGGSGGAGLE